MKKKFWIVQASYGQKGSALAVVLVVLMVVSLLGMTLLTVTTSNFKMTGNERDYQAVYYIAEAGINDSVHKVSEQVQDLSEQTLTHDEFFENLSEYIDKDIEGVELSDFASQFGKIPKANITVVEGQIKDNETSQYTERTISYVLNSKGQIGDRSRSGSSTIDISHRIEKSGGKNPAFNYVLFSDNIALNLPGMSIISGSLYSKDIDLASAGTNISENIISKTYVRIHGNGQQSIIKGNVCALDGDVEVAYGGGQSTVGGSVNASGKVNIGSGGTVSGGVFSGGDINLLAGSAKVLGSLNAAGGVILESGTSVKQNVFAGKNVELLNSNSRVYGNVHAGNDIYMQNNTYIDGNSWAGGSINQDKLASIKQLVPPRIQPIPPSFCISEPIKNDIPLHSFTAGDTDVKLKEQWRKPGIQTVLSGSYKDLYINGDNTVRLTGGNYYFNNINANQSNIKLQLDLSKGPINVYTNNNVTFGGGVVVSVSQNGNSFTDMNNLLSNVNTHALAIELAGKVYWEIHNNFKIAENDSWFGSVVADNNFTAGYAPRLIGAYAVNRGSITLGYSPTITYASPTDSAAGGSGGEGNGAGKNSFPLETRVKVSIPIREK